MDGKAHDREALSDLEDICIKCEEECCKHWKEDGTHEWWFWLKLFISTVWIQRTDDGMSREIRCIGAHFCESFTDWSTSTCYI